MQSCPHALAHFLVVVPSRKLYNNAKDLLQYDIGSASFVNGRLQHLHVLELGLFRLRIAL